MRIQNRFPIQNIFPFCFSKINSHNQAHAQISSYIQRHDRFRGRRRKKFFLNIQSCIVRKQQQWRVTTFFVGGDDINNMLLSSSFARGNIISPSVIIIIDYNNIDRLRTVYYIITKRCKNKQRDRLTTHAGTNTNHWAQKARRYRRDVR